MVLGDGRTMVSLIIALVAVVAVLMLATVIVVSRGHARASRRQVDGRRDAGLSDPGSREAVREAGVGSAGSSGVGLAEAPGPQGATEVTAGVVEIPSEPPSIRDRLGAARRMFASYAGLMLARGSISADTWQELEEALVRADVGLKTTRELLAGLREQVAGGSISTPADLIAALEVQMSSTLHRHSSGAPLSFEPGCTNVWLFVGVNGVGKTTTIGKVATREVANGRQVVIAAGDTFRAAATDQLELWAKRCNAGFVRGVQGGDPSAVIFDAVQHAGAQGNHLVLADTAGRLHTKSNLMEELKKIRRVAERPPGKVTEVLLVVDATTGQNGLAQAREFADAIGVTGVVLTKLDGTAKGGIVVAIQEELGIPVKLVGLGEGPADLVQFDPEGFVGAILH